MGRILDLERFRLRRGGRARPAEELALPASPDSWPLCRVRSFVQGGRPPRCCCGKIYTEAMLRSRAPVVAGIVRDALARIGRDTSELPQLLEVIVSHPELTSVERAALHTGPCVSCSVLSAQTEQVRFLWGLYRAYWARAFQRERRGQHGDQVAAESRLSAIDLRRLIRQEISLIRRLRQRVVTCPWTRRRQSASTSVHPIGC